MKKEVMELTKQKKYDEAIELVNSSIKENPDSSQGWSLLSYVHEAQNKLLEAESAINEAIKLALKSQVIGSVWLIQNLNKKIYMLLKMHLENVYKFLKSLIGIIIWMLLNYH